MSADLLRRAAERLRTHAAHATAGPWESLDDGDRLVAWRQVGDFAYVVDEPMSNQENAEYIALMHPPVAHALADWLEEIAFLAAEGARVPLMAAAKMARTVLREES